MMAPPLIRFVLNVRRRTFEGVLDRLGRHDLCCVVVYGSSARRSPVTSTRIRHVLTPTGNASAREVLLVFPGPCALPAAVSA